VIEAVFIAFIVATTAFMMTVLASNISTTVKEYDRVQDIVNFQSHLLIGNTFIADGIYVTIGCPETLRVMGIVVKYLNGTVTAFNISSVVVNWSVFNRVTGVWDVTEYVYNGTYFYRLVVPDYVNVTAVLLVTNESGKVVVFNVV